MIVVQTFGSIVIAELAKNLLEKKGVLAFVQKAGFKFPGDAGDGFGAGVMVAEKDLQKAKKILKDYFRKTRK